MSEPEASSAPPPCSGIVVECPERGEPPEGRCWVQFRYRHADRPGDELPDRVYLSMNRMTDKDQAERGWMHPEPGADGITVWTLVLDLPRALAP